MKRILSTFILSVLFTQNSMAQIKVWESPKANKLIQCTQWEVNDLVYHIREKIEAPLSKQVYAVVTGEAGVQSIPLFYNDEDEWVFRYSSSTVGSESFVLESDIKELDGKRGTFIVAENEKLDRHGGVVLNKENPQHLFYEDGSHYFNLAFECDWLFALDYGQKEIPKTKQLLSLLNEYGLTRSLRKCMTKKSLAT